MQLFVEKFEDIDMSNPSRFLAKAISLVVLDNPDYCNSELYKRLMYIKDNTSEGVLIPMHILDCYVSPSDDGVLNSSLGVLQEFKNNKDEIVSFTGFECQQYLFDCAIEIQVLISNLIRSYNFVSIESAKKLERKELPYPDQVLKGNV